MSVRVDFFRFLNAQCILGSPEGKYFKDVSNLSHSTTQSVVFYDAQ